MKHPLFRRPAWPRLVLMGAVLAVSDPGFAQVVFPQSVLRGEREELMSMNFQDAPLAVVLDHYANITGRTLLTSPRVPAALITIKSGSVSESEFLTAIEGAMAMHKVVLVPLGEKFLKVVDAREAERLDQAISIEPPSEEDPPETPSRAQALEIQFRDAPVSVVLDHYADITGRTVLMAPGTPVVLITVNSNGKLTEPEFLFAIETLLAMHNIALVPLGDRFLKVAPTSEHKAVPVGLPPERTPDADELDPHHPMVDVRFRDAPLAVVLDQYADIAGKTLIVSPKVPQVLITLRSTVKLSESEFLYAIETLLALNNIALIPEGEELLNVVRRRQ